MVDDSKFTMSIPVTAVEVKFTDKTGIVSYWSSGGLGVPNGWVSRIDLCHDSVNCRTRSVKYFELRPEDYVLVQENGVPVVKIVESVAITGMPMMES